MLQLYISFKSLFGDQNERMFATFLQSVPKILGSSINDVTVLGGGGGGYGICDNSTMALVIKRVTMGGGGVKHCPKLRDVIYGRPQCTNAVICLDLCSINVCF